MFPCRWKCNINNKPIPISNKLKIILQKNNNIYIQYVATTQTYHKNLLSNTFNSKSLYDRPLLNCHLVKFHLLTWWRRIFDTELLQTNCSQNYCHNKPIIYALKIQSVQIYQPHLHTGQVSLIFQKIKD